MLQNSQVGELGYPHGGSTSNNNPRRASREEAMAIKAEVDYQRLVSKVYFYISCKTQFAANSIGSSLRIHFSCL